jgi:hypothetical protein
MEMKGMKKISNFTAVLLAVLALASCYWRPNFSSGGLSLDVSGITPRQAGDAIRVYLVADGLLFSTGSGVPFIAEVSAVGGQYERIAIDGLPVGPKYKAMVGMGQVTNGVFSPNYYGESPEFVVTPNADTPVTMQITNFLYSGNFISYSPDLRGRSLLGVVESGSSVYTAEARKLYLANYDSYSPLWYLNDFYDLSADAVYGVSSYQANGLSQGVNFGVYPSTYLDSSNGVLPFYGGDGWSFNTNFSATLGGSKNIRQSGSFQVSIPGPEYFAYPVFFRRENGLGGTYVLSSVATDPSAWNWVNLDMAGVSDMAVSNYNAYFAAGGIAFALPPAFLQDAIPTLAGHRIDPPELASLPYVHSLGFRPSGVAPGGTLSLGTTDGVWQAVIDEASGVAVTPGPTQIAETAGDGIESIAIFTNSLYGNAEAYLSRYYLYIRTTYGVDKIPFFAVIPGRATGMAWGSDGTLYISGTEGLAAIAVAAYWGGSGI